MPMPNKCIPGTWPLKVIRARYEPEPSSMMFSKGSDDTDIILEADFYFKADVDALFANSGEKDAIPLGWHMRAANVRNK